VEGVLEGLTHYCRSVKKRCHAAAELTDNRVGDTVLVWNIWVDWNPSMFPSGHSSIRVGVSEGGVRVLCHVRG
jgi:hypothetical protein